MKNNPDSGREEPTRRSRLWLWGLVVLFAVLWNPSEKLRVIQDALHGDSEALRSESRVKLAVDLIFCFVGVALIVIHFLRRNHR